jgi:hypothetical protein
MGAQARALPWRDARAKGAVFAPETRELLAELETHMHAMAEEFDRSSLP